MRALALLLATLTLTACGDVLFIPAPPVPQSSTAIPAPPQKAVTPATPPG